MALHTPGIFHLVRWNNGYCYHVVCDMGQVWVTTKIINTVAMKKQIREILSKYRGNQGYTMEHAERELLNLFSVTTRTFRFSGMNDNVKFVVNVHAVNRETAIAYFETEHPRLTWRTTTEITEVT